ncbi:hypothetical protein HN873_019191, partial [Arachis hypogaea]
MLFTYLSVVKDVGRNDLAALIDSSQEVAKKSLEKAAECVRCLEEDMAKARKSFLLTPWLRPWWKKLFTLPAVDLRKKAVGGIIYIIVILANHHQHNVTSCLHHQHPDLKGLKFIAKGGGGGGGGGVGGAGWHEVEKQFDVLTTSTDGWLHRSLFGKCIVFVKLLRTVFDMVDKDADGRITKEEIKETICLSATTNKLSNIQQQAKEYAALIMEELDPEEIGFIMGMNTDTIVKAKSFLDGDEDQHEKDVFEKNLK